MNRNLESVLITEALESRPIGKANFESEKLAFQDIARDMVDMPDKVLPTLVEWAMEESEADSAGISILERSGTGPGQLRWHHVVGRYARHSGITFPAGEGSPAGICLSKESTVLMARPERVFPLLASLGEVNHEMLLVPFSVSGRTPSGALWAIHHEEGSQFDAGDARVMVDLAAFAGLAVRMINNADELSDKETRLRASVEHQSMLTREMSHRVNNVFALIQSMISMTARSVETTDDMARALSGRLLALARAHDLFKRNPTPGRSTKEIANLAKLVAAIFAPYVDDESTQDRLFLECPDIPIGEKAVTNFSLVLHELATNAVKYGALSVPDGYVQIIGRVKGDNVVLSWTEKNGPGLKKASEKRGFGTLLANQTITGQFDGTIEYDWKPQGLSIEIVLDLERISM